MAKSITKLKDQFFASCPTGLEEMLAQEIKILPDYKSLKVTKGGVHFEGTSLMALELILSSRTASRVYKKSYQFEVRSEKELYLQAKEIKWKSLFNLEQTFKISVVQSKSPNGQNRSKFKSSIFLAQNLKDAIVDRFRQDFKGERPSIDKEQADMNFLLHIEAKNSSEAGYEVATILIDLCGVPLHQRGYRDTNFAAPLKENLAAGLVLLSGYTGSENFVDPMCGSGTIIIESLLIKGQIPPSYLGIHEVQVNGDQRYWDFMQHNWYTKDKYLTNDFTKLLKKYSEKTMAGFKALENHSTKTFATDIEQYSINALKFNLKAADLTDFVEFGLDDAKKVTFSSIDSGIIITNPPYGERLGADRDLEELYYQLGENLKNNFKGFKAYIFTGNLPLIKKISLRTSKKHILFNGKIESRLAEYNLF